MKNKTINIYLPKFILDSIEKHKGKLTRDGFITQAIVDKLEKIRK